MSIPERFYRIARFKLHEIKDRIERWDAEAQVGMPDTLNSTKSSDRVTAIVELDQPIASAPAASPSRTSGESSGRSALSPSGDARRYPSNSSAAPTSSTTYQSSQAPPNLTDSLDYHYRLLGLEPGLDFSAVQDAYARLSARADPGRFPAGSVECDEAQQIRGRLEASYRSLRDALDPTARRFDLLEFDADRSGGPPTV